MVIIFRDCKYVIVHYSNFTLLQFWNVNPNRLTYSYFSKDIYFLTDTRKKQQRVYYVAMPLACIRLLQRKWYVWFQKTLDVQTHYKPTETFQYAHFSSSHLLSVKKGFIKRETLRLLRTNLANETFELRKLEFLTRLLERC